MCVWVSLSFSVIANSLLNSATDGRLNEKRKRAETPVCLHTISCGSFVTGWVVALIAHLIRRHRAFIECLRIYLSVGGNYAIVVNWYNRWSERRNCWLVTWIQSHRFDSPPLSYCLSLSPSRSTPPFPSTTWSMEIEMNELLSQQKKIEFEHRQQSCTTEQVTIPPCIRFRWNNARFDAIVCFDKIRARRSSVGFSSQWNRP